MEPPIFQWSRFENHHHPIDIDIYIYKDILAMNGWSWSSGSYRMDSITMVRTCIWMEDHPMTRKWFS